MSTRNIAAAVLAALGSAIGAVYVVQEWGVRPLGLVVAGALVVTALGLALVQRLDDLGLALSYVGSVLMGVGLGAAPAITAAIAGGSLRDWIPVYLAGGAGGLVLELTTSRGQVELPGPGKPADDAGQDPRRPLLPQVDLGFLARFLLGGLAAVVVLMVGAGAGGDDTAEALAKAAKSDLSIAWAVAIGSASTAVWQAIAKMVQARLDTVASFWAGADGVLSEAQARLQTLKKGDQVPPESGELIGAPSMTAFNWGAAMPALTNLLDTDPDTPDREAVVQHCIARLEHDVRPVTRSDVLIGIGETLGAIDAARAHLHAAAARAGVKLGSRPGEAPAVDQ